MYEPVGMAVDTSRKTTQVGLVSVFTSNNLGFGVHKAIVIMAGFKARPSEMKTSRFHAMIKEHSVSLAPSFSF